MENTKSLLKGETVVDVQRIINLENTISLKDATLGAKEEQIKNLKEQLKKTEQEQQVALEKVQKEVIIKTGEKSGRKTCNMCGYVNQSVRNSCVNCGATLHTNAEQRVVYKNLDDVVETIRKEEAKKLKVDINSLEQEIEDLKLKSASLEKQRERILKAQDEETLSKNKEHRKVKQALLESFEEEREVNRKEVKKLEKEIKNLKNNKTDELIELNRKKEIVELKTRIDELEKELKSVEVEQTKVFNLNNLFKKNNVEKLKVKALVEKEEKEARIRNISNTYPSSNSFWNFLSYPWGKQADPYGKTSKTWSLFF